MPAAAGPRGSRYLRLPPAIAMNKYLPTMEKNPHIAQFMTAPDVITLEGLLSSGNGSWSSAEASAGWRSTMIPGMTTQSG